MARDLERLAAGLRGFLPNGKDVTRVVGLSTGHSNETYLVEGVNLILRMPPSEEGLLPPYDMAREHGILAAVGAWKDRPPVPKVLQLCTDSAVMGDPFFLMERLYGEAYEYSEPDWFQKATPEMRGGMCAQWVNAVATVNRAPAASMPGPHISAVDHATHWRDVAKDADASRALIEVADELAKNPPRSSGPDAPVHGDPKLGNSLWNDCRMVALLDWEMAHVGEPLVDLGYMSCFYDQGDRALASAGFYAPGWWSRERLIAEWEAATGRTAFDMRRYEALGLLKISAIVALGYHLFRVGCAKDPRFEAWAKVLPGLIELTVERTAL